MKYKIIADSSSDLLDDYIIDDEIDFEVVPLTIHVDGKEFIDNKNLNVKEMLKAMHDFKGKSTSSCPSPLGFMDSYTADYNFVVTITSKLSGTYNCANLAATNIENKKTFVIDSKATSGTEVLIVDKLYELIKQGLSYETICSEIIKYRDSLELYFILNDFDNLVKNGRMSKIAASVAKIMAIKPICKAIEGEIKIHKKVRTRRVAIKDMVEEICAFNNENKKCVWKL